MTKSGLMMGVGMAVVGLVAAAGTAQQSCGAKTQCEKKVAAGACTSSTTVTFSGQTLPAQFKQLAGEWEGTLTLRGQDGTSTSSIGGATNRIDTTNGSLASCFVGNIGGQPVDGAVVFSFTKNNLFQSSSYISLSPEALTCTTTTNKSGNTFTFTGQFSDPNTNQPVTVQQVVEFKNADRYVAQWFIVTADGQRTRIMAMDMERLGAGELSRAANRFDEILASNNVQPARYQTANVPQAQ